MCLDSLWKSSDIRRVCHVGSHYSYDSQGIGLAKWRVASGCNPTFISLSCVATTAEEPLGLMESDSSNAKPATRLDTAAVAGPSSITKGNRNVGLDWPTSRRTQLTSAQAKQMTLTGLLPARCRRIDRALRGAGRVPETIHRSKLRNVAFDTNPLSRIGWHCCDRTPVAKSWKLVMALESIVKFPLFR